MPIYGCTVRAREQPTTTGSDGTSEGPYRLSALMELGLEKHENAGCSHVTRAEN